MDEERTPPDGVDQGKRTVQPEAEPTAEQSPFAGTMFAPTSEHERAMQREVRKRALVIGLAGGALASILMVICALLVYLVGTGG